MKSVRERLQAIDSFPCYLFVNGPARDYRTKYRSEHNGVFGWRLVYDLDDAVSLVEKLNYPGYPPDIKLIVISKNYSEEMIDQEL